MKTYFPLIVSTSLLLLSACATAKPASMESVETSALRPAFAQTISDEAKIYDGSIYQPIKEKVDLEEPAVETSQEPRHTAPPHRI